jgi:hypothetical protein
MICFLVLGMKSPSPLKYARKSNFVYDTTLKEPLTTPTAIFELISTANIPLPPSMLTELSTPPSSPSSPSSSTISTQSSNESDAASIHQQTEQTIVMPSNKQRCF